MCQEPHTVMVMGTGQHVVHDYDQPFTLHQIMVPGLEDRARSCPPLSTAKQLSPGALLPALEPACPQVSLTHNNFVLKLVSAIWRSEPGKCLLDSAHWLAHLASLFTSVS